VREVTETFNVFTYSSAPEEIKKKIIESFDDGELYDHLMPERIESLTLFAKEIGCRVDWSLSVVPDRGEYIRFTYENDEDVIHQLSKIDTSGECPFTGVCYDEDIIDSFRDIKVKTESDLLQVFSIIQENYIRSIHDEYESMISHSYISDHCEANEYEFTKDGILYSDHN